MEINVGNPDYFLLFECDWQGCLYFSAMLYIYI